MITTSIYRLEPADLVKSMIFYLFNEIASLDWPLELKIFEDPGSLVSTSYTSPLLSVGAVFRHHCEQR